MLFEPGNLPKGPQLQTKKALLLIDLQNDFVTSTGKLPVDNTAEFLPKLPALIKKFREKGPVVWVNTNFRQPCPTISPQTGGYNIVLKGLVEHLRQHPRYDVSTNTEPVPEEDENVSPSTLLPVIENDAEAFLGTQTPSSPRCCAQNTEGAAMPSALAASMDRQKDIIFSKSQYSAFSDFSLVMQLRARMVNDLYICGSLSNIGVYATVLDAVQQGFNITLVEDCLGFRDRACHIEAMTRMADDFCAEGIDYQELMDDLYGLLGDVIPASRYTRKFQLSQHVSGAQPSGSQKVQSWMATIDSEDEAEKMHPTAEFARIREVTPASERCMATSAALQYRDSPTPPQKPQNSPKQSPARKRSISDRDESGDTDAHHLDAPQAIEALSTSSPTTTRSSVKKSKIRATVREITPEPTRVGKVQTLIPEKLDQPASPGHSGHSRKVVPSSQPGERTMSQADLTTPRSTPTTPKSRKKKKPKYDPTYLGPGDKIGEGDTSIVHDILSETKSDEAFLKLKKEVAWQKMCHRTGEVPRLVAVQGTVDTDGAMPIYRHPADESPPLLTFGSTVDDLRQACEEHVGHKLNHVLIQYYRNGEDNISEHSDKSLDIVRGSSIVNLSLGAMRTMTLRRKKTSHPETSDAKQHPESGVDGAPRLAQRIRLPHGSLFMLGARTNASWLHSIRADKRPESEKSEEELAFGGERISLTFRNISTFVNLRTQLIWGQGASAKTKAHARPILRGSEADQKGEEMIIGFGKENHLDDNSFDWQTVYGTGFDVVNFVVTTANG
ncbi:hypothetical protein PMZ80_005308 [Knufia obscura]|uniref:Fe2OG dioxygenase domain-containing protein n=1 Tax=Knufia obscura TaxID=1635080 RepID=A0ABR0RQT0_9EURO|nr:hypothetical protein PMZ80_005308 [Knufia obscura]